MRCRAVAVQGAVLPQVLLCDAAMGQPSPDGLAGLAPDFRRPDGAGLGQASGCWAGRWRLRGRARAASSGREALVPVMALRNTVPRATDTMLEAACGRSLM